MNRDRSSVPDLESTTERSRLRQMAPADRQAYQLAKLNRLLANVLPRCPFYQNKYGRSSLQLESLDQLCDLPLLEKQELIRPIPGAPASFHSQRPADYVHFHQTSGTHGRPLPVLDTQSDWQWWINTWQYVLDAAEVTAQDVAIMAFSFGPFIGFWTAHDALTARGCLGIPTGGMSSVARLRLLVNSQATLLCCTPTYALRLVEVAAKQQIDLTESPVSRIIVAGEPGGSIPEVRQRIQDAWNAKIIDHSGATEVGAWGVGNPTGTGLHVIESEFIAEFLHPKTLDPAADGQLAELVLTGLGRYGGPAIRYRTGDLVRAKHNPALPCRFTFLEGGILGRADDMMVIRGVNVFPSGIEAVVRSIEGLGEYRMTATRRQQMDELEIEVEGNDTSATRLADELHTRLGLRIPIRSVPIGVLPRFEAKSQRLVDKR